VAIVDPALKDYAAAHTTAPRGSLAEVAAATRDTMPSPGMMSGRVDMAISICPRRSTVAPSPQ